MNFRDIGIYVHVPFCSNKCFYCDYSSVITKNKNMGKNYFEALLKEIKLYENPDLMVKTIYIGGGTPSHVSFDYIEEIKEQLENTFDLSHLEEFTIEMNPEDVKDEILANYKKIGVNRISVGIQSLDNNILKMVNRQNDAKTAKNAVNKIKKYFDNYNLDFILGLPGETIKSVEKNLNFISEKNPPHVSYYIYDNNHESVLNRMIKNKKISLPNYEMVEDFADLIYDYFEKNDYKRYEISSWAIFNKESLHNKIYWQNLEYIGFGVSAGGYYNSSRYVNTKNFSYYIKQVSEGKKPYDYYKKNDKKEDLIETLFMGLRLIDGIPLKKIKDKYPEYFDVVVNFLKKDNFFIVDENVRLSKKGLDYSTSSFVKILELEDLIT